jgi:hypothetical protein
MIISFWRVQQFRVPLLRLVLKMPSGLTPEITRCASQIAGIAIGLVKQL